MTPASIAVAFEWAIDVTRAQASLPALYVDPVISAEATEWSIEMASTGQLAEDPDPQAQLESYDPNWQAWGENVGVGSSPEALEDAFVA